MYESYNFDYLMDQLLSNVPTGVSTSEGSLVYAALAPLAFELERAYIELDEVLTQTFADTADYDFLQRRALERGLIPHAATYATAKGVFNCEIPEGSRFSIEELTYISGELLESSEESYTYLMTCEDAGTVANATLGTLEEIDYIEDLESAELTEIVTPGEDEEDEEAFRTRYLNSYQSIAFGGNIADYLEKTNEILGVGAVHVYPTWNGGGTVKLEILGSDYLPASADVVSIVRETYHPTDPNAYGLAPIGHNVTVVSASGVTLPVAATVTYNSAYTKEEVQLAIKEAVAEYFAELRKSWESVYTTSKAGVTVRVSTLETKILAVEGVNDVTDVKINGQKSNYALTVNQVPILGEVTV